MQESPCKPFIAKGDRPDTRRLLRQAAASSAAQVHGRPQSLRELAALLPLAPVVMLAAQVAIYLVVVALGFRIARVLDASDLERLRAALPVSLLHLVSRVRKYAV